MNVALVLKHCLDRVVWIGLKHLKSELDSILTMQYPILPKSGIDYSCNEKFGTTGTGVITHIIIFAKQMFMNEKIIMVSIYNTLSQRCANSVN